MTLTKNEFGYYEVRIKGPDGTYKTRTTGMKNKQEALAMIRDSRIAELEIAAEMGVLSQEVISVLLTNRRMTVAEAILPWKEYLELKHLSPRSVNDYVMWVKAWASWSNKEDAMLTSVKEEHLDPWINSDSKKKSATRDVMLTVLQSFFTFCSNKGWLLGNPAQLISVDMSLLSHGQKESLRRECFTDDEIELLLVTTSPEGIHPSEFWHAAIVISRYTGLRIGDICCLEWECLDLNPGFLTVWTRKRDKRVCLPLQPAILADTMAKLPREHPKFIWRMRQDLATDPARRSLLSYQFSRILGVTWITGKTFHCLRATYITDCNSKGIPMEHIARQVGHSNTETTKGYIRP